MLHAEDVNPEIIVDGSLLNIRLAPVGMPVIEAAVPYADPHFSIGA
jgi:hypothetical protein